MRSVASIAQKGPMLAALGFFLSENRFLPFRIMR
jgi:hypothetical protein